MSLNVLDTIVLQRDLPENNLCRGDVGAIVEVYKPNSFKYHFYCFRRK